MSELIKVSQICAMANCRVLIKDNGNGATLFIGKAHEAAKSRFSDCEFEAVSISGGAVILWLPREES